MSDSVDYEKVTRAIFQALVDQDKAQNISVEHNKQLQGKYLSHQCDVYWKFISAGMEYSTIVECKNWSRPVGASAVRDFFGKLRKSKVHLGIIFAKSGITGADSGADAVREIQSQFDSGGLYVLVFSLNDVRTIEDGIGFCSVLDTKADNLRFDL